MLWKNLGQVVINGNPRVIEFIAVGNLLYCYLVPSLCLVPFASASLSWICSLHLFFLLQPLAFFKLFEGTKFSCTLRPLHMMFSNWKLPLLSSLFHPCCLFNNY